MTEYQIYETELQEEIDKSIIVGDFNIPFSEKDRFSKQKFFQDIVKFIAPSIT